jgi:2-phospho-L-lactate guanylyltransferase
VATLILVPCKPLVAGKSRLAMLLTPADRHALCRRFLSNTLELATGIVAPQDIRVISPDDSVMRIAADLGIESLHDHGTDLNSAIAGAVSTLAAREPDLAEHDLLVLPIDLVRATEAALRPVLASPGDLVLVPDRQERGTNVLRLPGAVAPRFRFQFGDDSFARHLAEAERLRQRPRIMREAALAFDLDTPTDYREWFESCSHDRARA